MTTTLDRLATEVKHDPEILIPNIWSDLLHCVEVQCPCGNTARVRNGTLHIHDPAKTWDINGQGHPLISDAYATGVLWSGCRYTGRTVTLAAALDRDGALTPAEKRAQAATLDRLERGITATTPSGYSLPKAAAGLLDLAESSGWATQQAWVPDRDRDTEEVHGFTVNVRVSRTDADSGPWRYDLGWYLAPGIARRTKGALSRTPGRSGLHDTPSLKAVLAAIGANPVPVEG